MGKRGPKPRPRKSKRLEGTDRKDREARNAPADPQNGVPEPPDVFDVVAWGEESKREWFRMAGELHGRGLMSHAYRARFSDYCDAWGRWVYFREQATELGLWQVTDKGYRAQTPEASLMNRALDDLRKAAAVFGLSPSDISQVSATWSSEQEDEAAAFFGAAQAS